MVAGIQSHIWTFIWAEPSTDARLDFFEQMIRPVLIEQCYECHNRIDYAEGELALDWTQGMAAGGSSGPSIVAGKPEKSLLVQLIRHEVAGMEMPSAGHRLSPRTIADFEK